MKQDIERHVHLAFAGCLTCGQRPQASSHGNEFPPNSVFTALQRIPQLALAGTFRGCVSTSPWSTMSNKMLARGTILAGAESTRTAVCPKSQVPASSQAWLSGNTSPIRFVTVRLHKYVRDNRASASCLFGEPHSHTRKHRNIKQRSASLMQQSHPS